MRKYQLLLAILILGISMSAHAHTTKRSGSHGAAPVTVYPKNEGAEGRVRGFSAPFGYLVNEENEKNERLKETDTEASVLGGTYNGTGATPSSSLGTGFPASTQNGWVPYDAAVAVGPNHVVICTNEQIDVYTRAGALAAHYNTTNSFFPTDAGGSFDPKCYYDAAAGHFVLVFDQASSTSAYMNVAVSRTNDPTAGWWIYHLDWALDGSTPTANWGDYPSLGYDNSAIYIGTNQYSRGTNSYQYSKVRVLSKAQLFSGSTITWTDFVNLRNADGTSAFTVKAARMLSSSSSVYLLNTNASGGNNVTLWRIDNAPGNPVLTRVSTTTVGYYGIPVSARQPGGWVNTNDCRTQDVVVRNGLVYTAFTEKVMLKRRSYYVGLRYMVLSTAGALQKDISYHNSTEDRYFPAVTVDPSGNMFMVYSGSSATQYPSVYMAAMTATQTSIQAPVLLKAGSGLVSSGRWGDYSGIANDYSVSGNVWILGGYTLTDGTWGTYSQPVSAGVLPVAKTSATIASGAGEPAPGFHLDANYPNPFNPTTTIHYTLSEDGFATLKVYNMLGQEVATLLSGNETAGEHQAVFDAGSLPSGVYYSRLESSGHSAVQRMMLTK